MDEEIKQNWKERLKEFAIINEMFIRGFPMGKLEAFMEVELDLAVSKERERILEVIKSAKAYVVKIPEIDPSFGDLIDADLNFIEHKEGNVLFRHELINLINTK